MIRALGTTLAVAAALALGASAQAHTRAQASSSPHSKSYSAIHNPRNALAGCQRTRHHTRHRRCLTAKHRRAQAKKAHAALAVTGGLNLVSITPSSVRVAWNSLASAATARIFVGSHLIDVIPATAPSSYNVQQLWPSSGFTVTVVLRNGNGVNVARYSRVITTPARAGSVPRLYSPDTFINTPVAPAPALEPNSQAIVSQAFESYSSHANLADDDSWGIPVFHASPVSPTYDVGCLYYDCWYEFGAVHIPVDAQPQYGSDGHMVVMQPNGQEMDMWIAQHTADGWTSGERWLTSAYGSAANCTRVHGCGSADVAGFALAAGMVRPEEIAQGHIDHALAITTPDTRANYIACPATDTDGHHFDPDALPIGAHVQLDPSINVDKLPIPRWQKIIAVALQHYGAYVVDTGGSVALYAESDLDRPFAAWSRAGVPADAPSLADLPWGSMRVLSMTQCG
jgi:hypothetical protein